MGEHIPQVEQLLHQAKKEGLCLNHLLDVIVVHEVDEDMIAFNRETRGKDISCLLGYFMVEDENEERDLFLKEEDALGYRLLLINVRLNYGSESLKGSNL
jgi:hypothetical protein